MNNLLGAFVAWTAQRGSPWLGAALLMIGLTGCGGGGGGGSGGSVEAPPQDLSSRQYFPTAVGSRWLYAQTGVADPVVVKITDTRTVSGQTGSVVRSNLPGDAESVWVADAQGVKQVPGTGADAFTAAVGPVQLLRYPLRVGDSFTAANAAFGTTFDFDGDGIGDAATLQAQTVVVGVESISTSAGTLADCLHTRMTTTLTVQLSGLKRAATATQTSDYWMAPGIGLVRDLEVVTNEGYRAESSREIVGYGVGSLRSENVPPSATAPSIAPDTPLGPHTAIDIVFSEDMDLDTLPGVLSVSDDNGQAIPGAFSLDKRGIRFTPATAWTSGHYTARLDSTATDLVGNPLASSQAWPFTIDATAPVLVGSQPLEGAVDVPLASSIVLHFSEPVLPASVNASTVRALFDGSMITFASYQVSGSDVTLVPQSGWARGKSYSIGIYGVTDVAGNSVPATEVRFLTDPGRFGPSTALPTPTPEINVAGAVAVGDVTGDGRPDVVVVTNQFIANSIYSWQYGLMVYPQQADGLLGPGVQVPLSPGVAAISIAIGDVTGDGLKDVVVAEGDGGIEVFRQTPQGTLVSHQIASTSSASIVKLADMDGDGTLDIVAIGRDVVRVVLNRPGGWSTNDAVTVTSFARATDLVVGDISGDGRPDVLFTSDSMPNFAAVGVLRQASDGHLLPPDWLYDASHDTPSSLAVGDLDGDGRADLVLSFSQGLSAVLQLPNGTLGPFQSIGTETFAGAVKLLDVNGDGRLDVVMTVGAANLAVRLRQVDGTLAPATIYAGEFTGTGPGSGQVAVADINGDGRPDAIIAGRVFLQRPVPMMSESVKRSQIMQMSSLGAFLRATLRDGQPTR